MSAYSSRTWRNLSRDAQQGNAT